MLLLSLFFVVDLFVRIVVVFVGGCVCCPMLACSIVVMLLWVDVVMFGACACWYVGVVGCLLVVLVCSLVGVRCCSFGVSGRCCPFGCVRPLSYWCV